MIAIRMARSLVVYSTETPWPSGLRRGIKVPVRKGAGSNPAGVNFFFLDPLTSFPIFLHRDVEPSIPHPTRPSASKNSKRPGRYARRRPGWAPYVILSRIFCNTKYACPAYYWVSSPFSWFSRVEAVRHARAPPRRRPKDAGMAGTRPTLRVFWT